MRPEKQTLVAQIQQTVEGKNYVFLVSYMGITVSQQEELKSKLRIQKSIFQVYKNRLIKQAAKNQLYSGFESLDLIEGTALITGAGEAPSVAKVIRDFSKNNKFVQFKAAYFDEQVLEKEEARNIANLPTIDEARAQILGVLIGVPTNLVSVLNAKIATVINILKAIKEKKESES